MTTDVEFQSWSLQKVHDKLLHAGYTDLAQYLRSTGTGLNWGTTGQQIAQLNGLLAQAKRALDAGKAGPYGRPPDAA